VQDGVYDAFAERLAARVTTLKVGPGTPEDVLQGPLIDEGAVRKVEAHIADALAKGATLVCGGKRHALGGTYFEPTILGDAGAGMLIAREETFGPVGALFRFRDEAEAVRLANATEFGLAAYFYARDLGRVWRVAERLEYGIIGINTGLISTEVAPFGGVKQSGIGREGSKYGMQDYLELKYLCLGQISRRRAGDSLEDLRAGCGPARTAGVAPRCPGRRGRIAACSAAPARHPWPLFRHTAPAIHARSPGRSRLRPGVGEALRGPALPALQIHLLAGGPGQRGPVGEVLPRRRREAGHHRPQRGVVPGEDTPAAVAWAPRSGPPAEFERRVPDPRAHRGRLAAARRSRSPAQAAAHARTSASAGTVGAVALPPRPGLARRVPRHPPTPVRLDVAVGPGRVALGAHHLVHTRRRQLPRGTVGRATIARIACVVACLIQQANSVCAPRLRVEVVDPGSQCISRASIIVSFPVTPSRGRRT
jgi:Aldehyde dehydrogenase family